MNQISKEKGYELVDIQSNCNQMYGGGPIFDCVEKTEYQNDTLNLDISAHANCVNCFLAEI